MYQIQECSYEVVDNRGTSVSSAAPDSMAASNGPNSDGITARRGDTGTGSLRPCMQNPSSIR